MISNLNISEAICEIKDLGCINVFGYKWIESNRLISEKNGKEKICSVFGV